MRMGALLLVAGLALYPLPPTIWLLALVIPLVPMGTALLFPSVTALSSGAADPRAVGQTMGVQQAFGARGAHRRRRCGRRRRSSSWAGRRRSSSRRSSWRW